MTRKLGEKVKVGRAMCRMKCGRGVKIGKVGTPKPQKGKASVHIGSSSKGGGIFIPYNKLSKEQKEDIINSGIPNVAKTRSVAIHPTVNMLKRMGEKRLIDLRDKGTYVRHDTKGGKKTINYPDGKTPKDIKDKINTELDNRFSAYSKKVQDKEDDRIKRRDDRIKKKEDILKAKLQTKIDNGTERQKKASIAQMNKKYKTNLVYNKPEKAKKAPKKAPVKAPKKAPAKSKVKATKKIEPVKAPKKVIKPKKEKVIKPKKEKAKPVKAKKLPTQKQLDARQKFSEMSKAKSKAKKEAVAPKPAPKEKKARKKRRTKAEMEADKK